MLDVFMCIFKNCIMKKRVAFLLYLVLLFPMAILAQNIVDKKPEGGGEYASGKGITDELSPAQRASIIAVLQRNEQRLRSEGKINSSKTNNIHTTLFAWPLKQALGFNDNGFYGISNYIDHAALPDTVRDYNCGTRSYDLPGGYNHRGTDIFTWPFYWTKMNKNAVEIIAAAPGTILAKGDGEYDQNCAMCSGPCDWNAVYVMHADGSVAWYGHMKSGSLTTKPVGASVALGEYLGVVGSSGSSTGPHLHFEVYTNSSYTQLVDPWAGPCNALNGNTSWWASQQAYYVPTINKVMLNSGAPVHTLCPTGETTNEKINFKFSDTIFPSSYFRDQRTTTTAPINRIFLPNGNQWVQWNGANSNYISSWWYYSFILPSNSPGIWRYECTYGGGKATTYFTVGSAPLSVCTGSDFPITSTIAGNTYQWQVNDGSGYVNISDNNIYVGSNARQLKVKAAPTSLYGYKYKCLVNGTSASDELTIQFINNWIGGKSTAWEDPANWSCGNVPDANMDVVINAGTTFAPFINSNAVCRSTKLSGSTTKITVVTGARLTVVH